MKKIRLKISKRLSDHIINAVLIFASVFLAFWMNEVREERKAIDVTHDARMAILAELKINLIILERWTPYHENALALGIDSVLHNVDTIGPFNWGKLPGLDNGILREIISSNARDLIKDPQVQFDIQTRMIIGHIYEQHEYVTRAVRKITDDFLTQRALFDETKTHENYTLFYSLLGELIGQEKAFMARLKETIAELEK